MRTSYNKKIGACKSKKTLKPFKPISNVRPLTAKPLHAKATLTQSLHGRKSSQEKEFALD
jgi:hypothetical protein